MTNNLASPFVARGNNLFYRKTRLAKACRSEPFSRPACFIAHLGPSMDETIVDEAIERNDPGHWHTAPGDRYAAVLLNLPQHCRQITLDFAATHVSHAEGLPAPE